MLEDQRGPLRGDAVELLLFGDEVHLGLRLELVAHHCLLLGVHSLLELESRLAHRLDEAEALVLVTRRHGDSLGKHRMVHLRGVLG